MKIFNNKSFITSVFLRDNKSSFQLLKKLQKFTFSTSKEQKQTKQKKKEEEDNEEDKLSLMNMTSSNLIEMKKEIEEKITEGEFTINFVPTPNYFGEIPIFIAPNDFFTKRMNVELSGFTLVSSITVLNYLGIIYPPSLFYYFSFLTIASAFKLITRGGQENQIILMTLKDEKNVRIVYLSGKEEEVPIKNIVFQTDDMYNKQLLDSDDRSNFRRIKENSQRSESRRMLGVSLMINNKRKIMVLRNNVFRGRNSVNDLLAFVDLTMLLGIVNKKTKRVNFNVNLKNQTSS
jgi:hypothetical protein